MALPKWSGSVLHALGGAAITAVAVLIGVPGWIPLVLVSAGGWVREKLQHLPWNDPLTFHQWIEAAAWAAGSALAWLLVGLLK